MKSQYNPSGLSVNYLRCLSGNNLGCTLPRMDLAQRLKTARKEAGLSQARLAELSKVSQQMISKLESGRSTETAGIVRLALACDVRPEWLESGAGPMRGVDPGHALAPSPPDPYATLTERQRLALHLLEGMTDAQAAEWLRQGQERERENREVIEELSNRGKGKRVGGVE
jgi:transcriptional regulator with XRE-family HTH domain